EWRAKLGVPVKIQDMPWGYTGPRALTWHLYQNQLQMYASPIDDFYPVHWSQTPLLTDPDLSVTDVTTPRTRILHLSNEKIRTTDLTQVPPTSPLGSLLAL